MSCSCGLDAGRGHEGTGKLLRGIGNVNLLDWRGFDANHSKTFPV
jgi:hypothetical protein